MTTVGTRELRNGTADLLRRVQAGEQITITVNGEPVAELVPIRPTHTRPYSTDEVLRTIVPFELDPTLASDLAWISEGELEPIQ